MSIRKLLMVSIVAMAAILPLAGCNGGGPEPDTDPKTDVEADADNGADNGDSPHTTIP